MPGISIPTIVNAIAPYMIPSGVPTSPGGIKVNRASPWQGETPPAEILNADELFEFVQSQQINQQRNAALAEAVEISDDIKINEEVDLIIERNKKTLGLTGGPNGFYDINLITPASGMNSFSDSVSGPVGGSLTNEPDGFRLYLMIPPSPAKSVALAADAIGSGAEKAGQLVQGLIDNPITQTLEGAVTSDAFPSQVTELGEKAAEVGKAIKQYMQETKAGFEEKFNQYVKKAYDEHPDGNTFYSVVLPMPQELVDTHSHQLDNMMLGILPRLLVGLGEGIGGMTGSKDSKTKRRTSDTATNAFSSFAGNLTGVFGPLAAEAGAFVADNARLRLGVGLNPNVESVYSNPQPRKFQFTFNLYPKSPQEVSLVKDFINRVKQHSYPLSVLGIGGQSQLYLYPGEVYFEFSGRYRNNLFRSLRPCIIEGLTVSYSSGDQYQHFEDGNPIVYVVTLNLVENRLLDRNILVDDVEKYSNDTFANNQFRETIKFTETAWGKGFEDAVTDPERWARENLPFFGNTPPQGANSPG